MDPIIIAIDGHSSCGKSTLAKALSKKMAYAYIDTGAMYRAVTLFFLQNKVYIHNPEAVAQALQEISISFKNDGIHNITYLNGVNVEEEIRKMYISNEVSNVAAISAVRKDMVRQQQAMGINKAIVMDGRDIGTVVFPNAALKIFLTADEDIRTQRRYDEMIAKGYAIELEAVKANLMERDRIDSSREDSPLKKADDAITIDNSLLTPDEQLDIAHNLALKTMHLTSGTSA